MTRSVKRGPVDRQAYEILRKKVIERVEKDPKKAAWILSRWIMERAVRKK
jgi:hypothetical protein